MDDIAGQSELIEHLNVWIINFIRQHLDSGNMKKNSREQ